MNPVLAVEGLTITTTSGAVLVDDISFTLAPGEQLGLIGESGSGKSVTSLALIGLLPRALKATGSIQAGGVEVIGASEAELTRLRGSGVAMVSQDPSRALDPLARIGSQVAEPLRRHRRLRNLELRAEVERALAEVALPDLDRIVHSFPHELSGGQRQRVAMAMAIACRPSVLIADEPTTALDVTVQAEVTALLAELSREHTMAMLFISHDIALVSGVVDSAIVMKDGKIVERGPIAQIVTEPRHPYTRSLVGSAAALENALTTGTIR